MITIYKNKDDIPNDIEYVELNDIFFNQKAVIKLDDRAEEIIEKVDGSKLVSKYKIDSMVLLWILIVCLQDVKQF